MNKIQNEDFDHAGEEFEQLKWANRLAIEKQRRDESLPILPELNFADQPPVRFTPSFSIEPSDVTTPSGRKGKPRAAVTGKKGKQGAASASAAGTRRTTR